ncbi:MAG: alpha/beta hydrolase [Hyphomicrobiaceae bacterium]|nr:alpha/beta hydrolase [Hyphomicrobiaceae bacterium]
MTLSTGPHDATRHLLLAHGAGGPMTSPFLEAFAGAMAGQGVAVHRFEFSYMAARRAPGGKRRPPPAAAKLVPELITHAMVLHRTLGGKSPIAIGGKSMGGRVATMAARELADAGIATRCVCLGYPFHPPGKPDKIRIVHLADTGLPVLMVQGERDPFGCRAEVEGYNLPPHVTLHWLPVADHDYRPTRGSGRSTAQTIANAATAVATFLRCDTPSKLGRSTHGAEPT